MDGRWMAVLRLHTVRVSFVLTFIQVMNISNTELFDLQALFLLSCRQHVHVLTSGLWYIMVLAMWMVACHLCWVILIMKHSHRQSPKMKLLKLLSS